MLAERIQAGWQPSQIRAAIGDRGLDGTRRLSSIVAYRLRENVHPDMAPARLAREAEELDKKRRKARLEAENTKTKKKPPRNNTCGKKSHATTPTPPGVNLRSFSPENALKPLKPAS